MSKLTIRVGFYGPRVEYQVCPICGHVQIAVWAYKMGDDNRYHRREIVLMESDPCSCPQSSVDNFVWTRGNDISLGSQYYVFDKNYDINRIKGEFSKDKKLVCYSDTLHEDDSISVDKRYYKLTMAVIENDIKNLGLHCRDAGRPIMSTKDFLEEFVKAGCVEEDIAITGANMANLLSSLSFTLETTETFEYTYRYAPESLEIKYNGQEVPSPYKPSFLKRAFAYVTLYYPPKTSIWYVCTLANCYSLNTAINSLKKNPFLASIHSTYKSLAIFNYVNPFSDANDSLFDKTKTKPHEAFKLNKNVFRVLANNASNLYVNRTLIERCQTMNAEFGPQTTENILKEILKYPHRNNSYDVSTLLDIKLKCKDAVDMQRLIEYLKTDIDIYQGITSPTDGLQLLSDYYNICDKMHVKPAEWLPKSLKLTHDIAAKNLKIIIDKNQEEMFQANVSSPEYQQYVEHGKEWSVIAPTCSKDLIIEGRKQSHCVGSYIGYVAEGSRKILFMRRTEDLDTPVLTLDIMDGRLNQCKGVCNRSATKEEMDFVHHWADKHHLTLNHYL